MMKRLLNLVSSPLKHLVSPLYRERYSFRPKQDPAPVRLADATLGRIYYKELNLAERYRVNRHNRVTNLNKANVWYRPRLRYALKFIVIITVIFFVIYGAEWLIVSKVTWFSSVGDKGFASLSKKLGSYLGYLFAGLIALLAILPGLLSTGYQIAADKYSSNIVAFIFNQKQLFYPFKLIVGSTIFVALNLLTINLISYQSVSVLIISILLGALSVLVIFIDIFDLLQIFRPKQIFREITTQIQDSIKIATDTKRHAAKSWSVVKGARNLASEGRAPKHIGHLYLL